MNNDNCTCCQCTNKLFFDNFLKVTKLQLQYFSYVYLLLAGPAGIEPTPLGSKPSMISISPRTAKEKPRGGAKHSGEVLHRCPGPCCLVLQAGIDPASLHYQCSVLPLYYKSRAPWHCTRASFTASLQLEGSLLFQCSM